MNPSLLIAYQAGTALWGQVTANLHKPKIELWPDLIRSQLYFRQILATEGCPPSYAHRSHFYLGEIDSLNYIWSVRSNPKDLDNMELLKDWAMGHYNLVLKATAHKPEQASLYLCALWSRARFWYCHRIDSLTLEDTERLLRIESQPRFLLLRSRCFLRQGLLEAAARDSLVALEWFAAQQDPQNEAAVRLGRDLKLVCEHLKLELAYAQSLNRKESSQSFNLKETAWFDALPAVIVQLGELWRPHLKAVLGKDLLGYFLHVAEATPLKGSDGAIGGEQVD